MNHEQWVMPFLHAAIELMVQIDTKRAFSHRQGKRGKSDQQCQVFDDVSELAVHTQL
jgi:hypothetical protein